MKTGERYESKYEHLTLKLVNYNGDDTWECWAFDGCSTQFGTFEGIDIYHNYKKLEEEE